MKIYLAGPMEVASRHGRRKFDFSTEISPGDLEYGGDEVFNHYVVLAQWRAYVIENNPFHQYLVPESFAMKCEPHSSFLFASDARDIAAYDLDLIRSSDTVVAFIDSVLRWGTLGEIAFAAGLGKPIAAFVMYEKAFTEFGPPEVDDEGYSIYDWREEYGYIHDELWFVLQMANIVKLVGNHAHAYEALSAYIGTLAPSAKCMKCGRPLAAHASVSSGLGPQCAAKLGRQAFGKQQVRNEGR